MKGTPPQDRSPYPLPGQFDQPPQARSGGETPAPPYQGRRRSAQKRLILGLKGFSVIYVGATLLLGIAIASIMFVQRPDKITEKLERKPSPFTWTTFFEDERHFTMRINQTTETYDRTGEKVLEGSAGCLAGAIDAATRTLLSNLGCDGRIEASFTTPSKAQVSVHVLRLKDKAAAETAETQLKAAGMRFVTTASVPKRIGARFGKVGSGTRYAVVTAAVSPRQKDAQRIANRGGGFIHAETTAVAIWS
ncbi:hypothetical protein [Actinomadura rudentiformis]|uniref:Uncharacterized protein n=1 Tax=Actinomadura rudentiformis TaxID=359158 RepID=A0A6H9YXG2_9ACTN|nr:hypothetical protein [Actinomadura rudentiformis]KAB2350935.1 hypothetical protein F8566_08255 [Actinomadura rudentiformis]